MSAAVRIREQEPAVFPSGRAREARYLHALEALLRERAAVGEQTLAIWGSRQKPPLVGTEVERLMSLLVEQGVASSFRRHINAPLLWKLVKPSAPTTPEPSAPTTPEPFVSTFQTSQLPDSQRPPSSLPPPARRQKTPTSLVRDTAPSARPAPTAPPAPAELPVLPPSPADLLHSLPPAGPILPPRPDASPTTPSPLPPSGEENLLTQLTSEIVLTLGLSLRDRERLGQQLIAIGQLLRGDLKPSPGLQGLSESTARVFQAMTSTPETPVEIARRLGMDGQQVSNAIKTLSLRGLVVRVAYGLWRLA